MPEIFTDTLARALGSVVRDFRSDLDQHIEAVRLQAAAISAEAQARVAEAEARRDSALADLMMRVQDRLAGLKDGRDGVDGKDADISHLEARIEEKLAQVRDGIDGRDGNDGKDGADGRDGIDGKDADISHLEARVSEAIAAIKDGADGRDGSDGKDGADGLDGRDGIDGKDGASITPRGTFDPEAEYSQLDVVMLNGSSFVATMDAPGECPGGGWQLLASRGSRGDRGDRGEAGREGKQGERGEKGAPGDSPVALYFEGRDLIITMSSGAELRAELPSVRK